MSSTTAKYWRRILASSAVYAAAGWAVVEASLTVIERFGLPAWLSSLVIALYISGLPITIFLVWRSAGIDRKVSLTAFLGAISFLGLGTIAIFWFTRPPLDDTIAILPCAVDNEDVDADRAEGFAEDIHTRLSRVDALKVISWNSSLFVRDRGFDSMQIAETLNINRLLRCHMNSNGGRLSVSAELLDPGSGRVFWSHDYDFSALELGTVVTELSRTLLDVLHAPAEAAELNRVNDIGTLSPEAYDLYLRAQGADAGRILRPPGGGTTLANDDHDGADPDALLRRALEIDSGYAEAMVILAINNLHRAMAQEFEDMDELLSWIREARSLSHRALDVDSDILNARMNLATVCDLLGEYFGEPCAPGEIEQLLLEECQVRGETAGGWACRVEIGDDEEEINVALQRWLELEPTSVEGNMQYMSMLHDAGAPFLEVLTVFETLRTLEPDDRRPFGLVSNMLRNDGMLDEVLAWRFGSVEDRLPEDFPWHLARLGTDYMNLGLYEQAMELGLMTWETRRASATHFLPILWVRAGERDRASAAVDWMAENIVSASGSNAAWLMSADFYASVSRDFERAKELYERALGAGGLVHACEGDDECVTINALRLAHIEKVLGNDTDAANWLREAQYVFERISDESQIAAVEPSLRTVQGRYEEAIQKLRDGVFNWHGAWRDLTFPIYLIEGNAYLDPLRDLPEFQQLLDDYHSYLRPMQERVLRASESGDWGTLRQRTYRRAWGEID